MTALAVSTPHAPPGFLPWVAVLVHRHRAALLGQARRQGLVPEDALDAVQDTFIAFLSLPQARPIAEAPDDAARVLSVMLRHDVMNRRRKANRHARVHRLIEAQAASESPSSEGLVATAEELGRVQGCILRMAALQQRVVMLSLLDEQAHDTVADVLNISPGYVRVLLHRAREHLKTCTFNEAQTDAN